MFSLMMTIFTHSYCNIIVEALYLDYHHSQYLQAPDTAASMVGLHYTITDVLMRSKELFLSSCKFSRSKT